MYKFTHENKAVFAHIYLENELVKIVDLEQSIDDFFSIPQNNEVVFHTTNDGKISFYSSDCPDKICIHSGELYLAGQSATCLPNKILLKIVAKENSDIDFVT